MTDRPRFSAMRSNPHDAHLHYFGGGFVDFTLSLTDKWLRRRAHDDSKVEIDGPSLRREECSTRPREGYARAGSGMAHSPELVPGNVRTDPHSLTDRIDRR